jgi:filamentous hemagglutinin family protein
MAGTLCLAARVDAAPQGAQVAHGSAAISQAGNKLTIRPSDNAVINYKSFNIDRGETVQFIQRDANSRVLNRVTDANPSHLFGTLQANGRVYLVNPYGIYAESGSVITTASFIAAAGRMNDADFLAGTDHFQMLSGEVVNRGLITAKGNVSLFGANLANFGSLVSETGTVTMASGTDVLIGKSTGNVFVNASLPASGASAAKAGVQNAGRVQARRAILAAGDLYSVAVSNTGIVKSPNVLMQGGAHSTVSVSGSVEASNTARGGKGGKVQFLAGHVELRGATVDASGAAGGGTILVGGDTHGAGATQTATTTSVDAATTLRADATVQGNGGKVVVWSNERTDYSGAISARGAGTGAGGFAEVSGKNVLNFLGTADLTAPRGRTGTLLLDPSTLTITDQAADSGSLDTTLPTIPASAVDVVPNTISRGSLENLAATVNISLQATGQITVNDLAGNLLDLKTTAGNSVTIHSTTSGGITFLGANDEIRTAGGDLTLIAGGTGTLNLGKLTTAGGAIILTGSQVTMNGAVAGGSLAVTAATGISFGVVPQGAGPQGPAVSVTTSGSQTYSGATTLAVDAVLTSTTNGVISLGSVASGSAGARSLTVSNVGTGRVSLGGAIGQTNALSSLDVTGGGIDLNTGTIRTTGNQTYTGSTTLIGDAVLTSTGGGTIQMGIVAGPAGTLTISSAGTGHVTLGGAIGGGGGLAKLIVTGGAGIALNGGTVTTTGDQTYSGASTLGVDTVLTSTDGTVTLFDAVDGTADGAQALDIKILGAGKVVLGNAIGDNIGVQQPLKSLTIAGGTDIRFNGATIKTKLDQSYGGAVGTGIEVGPVTLRVGTVHFTAGTGAITFKSTVDAASNGSAGVQVTTGGVTTFKADVGEIHYLTAVTIDGAGAIALDGTTIRTSGAQMYKGDVTTGPKLNLLAPTLLGSINATFEGRLSPGGDAVVANLGVDGNLILSPTATLAITVDSDKKKPIGDLVGATLQIRLQFDDVNGRPTFQVVTRKPPVAEKAIAFLNSVFGVVGTFENSTASPFNVPTSSDQYNLAYLSNQVTVTRAKGAYIWSGGANTGDWNTPGNWTNDSVPEDGDVVTFDGFTISSPIITNQNTGDVLQLSELHFLRNAKVEIQGSGLLLSGSKAIEETGAQADVTIGVPIELEGAQLAVFTTTGPLSLWTVESSSDTPLTIGGSGKVTLGGSLGTVAAPLGAVTITVPTRLKTDVTVVTRAGAAVAFDALGSLTIARNLTVKSGGATTFNGAIGLNVALGALAPVADLTVTSGGNLSFKSTVDGSGDLDVTSGGTTTFDGAVGATTPFSKIDISGVGNISFKAGLDGSGALDVSSDATTTFGGRLGAVTPFSTISVTGAATFNTDQVISGSDQHFNNAVVVGQDITFKTGGAVVFHSTLNAADPTARDVKVDAAGKVTFTGSVGLLHPLHNLETTLGPVEIDGAAMKTTGTQTYGGTVSLALSNVTFTAESLSFAQPVTGPAGGNVTFVAAGQADGILLNGALDASVTHGMAIDLSKFALGFAHLTVGTTLQDLPIFANALLLPADTTLYAGTKDVHLMAVDSLVASRSLQILTDGTTTFGGSVGALAGSPYLQSLTVTGNGLTVFSGGFVNTIGDQFYGGALSILADATVNSAKFTVTTDLRTSAGLILTSSNAFLVSGNATLGGIANLTTTGNLTVSKSLTSTGALTVHSADFLVGGEAKFQAQTDLTVGKFTVSQNLTTTAGLTVHSGDFEVGVDAGFGAAADLTVASFKVSHDALFQGISTVVSTGNFTVIHDLKTTRALTVTSADALVSGKAEFGDDASFTASKFTITGTVENSAAGVPNDLTVLATGKIKFGSTIGLQHALGALSLTSPAGTAAADIELNGNTVATTGLQKYGGNVLLNQDTTFSAGSALIQMNGRLNAANRNVTFDTTGAVELLGGFGTSSAQLVSLHTKNATSALNIALDNHVGTLQVDGNLIALTDATIKNEGASAGSVTVSGNITSDTRELPDPAHPHAPFNSLTLDHYGAVTIGGSVGTDTLAGLSKLTVRSASTLDLGTLGKSITVHTLGDQTYTGVPIVSGSVPLAIRLYGDIAFLNNPQPTDPQPPDSHVPATRDITFGGTINNASSDKSIASNVTIRSGGTVAFQNSIADYGFPVLVKGKQQFVPTPLASLNVTANKITVSAPATTKNPQGAFVARTSGLLKLDTNGMDPTRVDNKGIELGAAINSFYAGSLSFGGAVSKDTRLTVNPTLAVLATTSAVFADNLGSDASKLGNIGITVTRHSTDVPGKLGMQSAWSAGTISLNAQEIYLGSFPPSRVHEEILYAGVNLLLNRSARDPKTPDSTILVDYRTPLTLTALTGQFSMGVGQKLNQAVNFTAGSGLEGNITITAPTVHLSDITSGGEIIVKGTNIILNYRPAIPGATTIYGTPDVGTAVTASVVRYQTLGGLASKARSAPPTFEERLEEFVDNNPPTDQPLGIGAVTPSPRVSPRPAPPMNQTVFNLIHPEPSPKQDEGSAANNDEVATLSPADQADLEELGIRLRLINEEEQRQIAASGQSVYRQPIEGTERLKEDEFKVVVNRVTKQEVTRTLEVYRRIKGTGVGRGDEVNALMHNVTQRYTAVTGGADSAGLEAWMKTQASGEADAACFIEILQRLHLLYSDVASMGLTSQEVEISKNAIAQKYSGVAGVSPADFRKLIEQAAVASAFAPRLRKEDLRLAELTPVPQPPENPGVPEGLPLQDGPPLQPEPLLQDPAGAPGATPAPASVDGPVPTPAPAPAGDAGAPAPAPAPPAADPAPAAEPAPVTTVPPSAAIRVFKSPLVSAR